MIVVCLLSTGCVVISTKNETIGQTPSSTPDPSAPNSTTTVPRTPVPTIREIPPGVPYGKLNISIGNYNAILPVFLDNVSAGQVSAGNVLNLNVMEGNYTIRICSGSFCETIDVPVYSAITTTIDFEERLNRDVPLGLLNVSIGGYNARLPVYIDDMSAGNVSLGKPLYRGVSAGNHSVKICILDECFTEDVEIKPPNQTMVDFESRLNREGRMADLVVSIGGYNAQELQVFLDNTSAGLVSQGRPLTIQVNTGVHEVKVCSGVVCPKKQIEVKFGKQNFIDFGEQLLKDAEYVEPTVRIVDYTMNGNYLRINAEYINPTEKDLTLSATFSCVYSYKDYSTNTRLSSFGQGISIQYVHASNRVTSATDMYLSGGSDIIVSEPVVLRVTSQ